MEQLIQTVTVYAIPVLLAITLHEAAHGYVARMLGDQTAHLAGRITLNPLKHIDPVGTIAVPLLILIAAKALGSPGLLFGWAKPVPVNFGNLRRPKQDMLWVAAAGPGANLAMALGWALVLKFAIGSPEFAYAEALREMALVGVRINGVLMVLNLLPLPPLDGGRIVTSLLPHRAAWKFSQLERWGFPILLALLFLGVLDTILRPLLWLFNSLIRTLFGF